MRFSAAPAILPQGRIIAQGDMEYVCWGSKKEMTVGQKVKGDFW